MTTGTAAPQEVSGKRHMELGPNMRRLLEMPLAEDLEACVVSGPADLEEWEVHSKIKTDELPLEIVGRGTDMESAAAAVLAVIQRHPWGPDESVDAASDANIERRLRSQH